MEVDEEHVPSREGVGNHLVLAMGNNSDGQLGCGVFWKTIEEGFFVKIGLRLEGFNCWLLFFLGGELLVVLILLRFVGCIFVTKRLTTVTGRFG